MYFTFFGVSVDELSLTSGPESSGILRIMFSSLGSSCMTVGEGIDGMFWNKEKVQYVPSLNL